MASAEMGWGVFLILLILSGGIFCAIFFPCRGAAARRAAQRRLEALHALDALVLAADHGDMSAQQQLAAEKARLNVTNNEYLSYRRALYTRLAQNGDAFAEYQLGEDARLCLRQPRAAYDHYYRAANLGALPRPWLHSACSTPQAQTALSKTRRYPSNGIWLRPTPEMSEPCARSHAATARAAVLPPIPPRPLSGPKKQTYNSQLIKTERCKCISRFFTSAFHIPAPGGRACGRARPAASRPSSPPHRRA